MRKHMLFLWAGVLALNIPMLVSASDAKLEQAKTEQASPHKNVVSHTEKRKAAEIILSNSSKKLSYAFGMQVGDSLKQGRMKIDTASFMMGFKDNLEGKKPLLSPQKAKTFRDRFFEKKRQLLAEKNLIVAKKFLAENKGKKGIATTSSHLQYLMLRNGYGAHPESSSIVRVQYSARLANGSEFYSTYKKGRSVVLPVNEVIHGLGEAFKLMTVGSRYRFFIPPELAYGEHGSGKKIEPNAALIYEVELLAIENPKFNR